MSATSHKQNEKKNVTAKAPREGSVVWAAIQVLDGKRTPMHPDEITAEIQKRGLAKKLDGKTPNASVAARLAVHAAQGLYFERPEKGKYQLKKGVTAKSLTSSNSTRTGPPAPKRRTVRKTAAAKPERMSTADTRRSETATAARSEATSEQATPEPESATA